MSNSERRISYVLFFFCHRLQAVERCEKDCPICIMPLGNISEGNAEIDSPRRGKRVTVLLSCTHVFHLCCLEAFEELSLGVQKICPVCRGGYQKRVQDLWGEGRSIYLWIWCDITELKIFIFKVRGKEERCLSSVLLRSLWGTISRWA